MSAAACLEGWFMRTGMTVLILVVAVAGIVGGASAQDPGSSDSVTVDFRSEPEGAQVSVDGKPSCKAPCKALLFRGKHVIGMELAGFFAREELLDLQASRTIRWQLEVQKGRLSIASSPDGLSIVIRRKKGTGEWKARTPVDGMELAPGGYVVKLVDERFEAIEREVEVPPGDAAEVELEPRATMGTLFIRVVDEAGDPGSADLFVDGRKQQGAGPWPLKPGKHRVQARKDGKVLLDQEVEVEAGDELDVEVSTGAEG